MFGRKKSSQTHDDDKILWLTALGFSVSLLAACATPQQVLQPVTNVPSTCESIDAEMLTLAEKEGQWRGINQAKDGTVMGVSVAAAAGLLPAGFAWAPIGAMVIQQLSVPSKVGRINYLAQIREIRECEPLSF